MAKAYILTEADFERLKLMVDRDPRHGTQGGSSAVLSRAEQDAHAQAHRFFNYQIHEWISEVTK